MVEKALCQAILVEPFFHTSALSLLKNSTADTTFRGEALTGTSADTQRLSATAAGVLEDSGKASERGIPGNHWAEFDRS